MEPTTAQPKGSPAFGALAGCPFCGSENIRVKKMTPLGVAFLVAQCRGRDCKVEMSQGMDLEAKPESHWQSRLAERWNRRANAESLPTLGHDQGNAQKSK